MLHLVHDRLCRGEDMVTPTIETAKVRFGKGPRPVQAIISKVGLEERVEAADDGNAKALGKCLRASAENVGRRDVEQIGREMCRGWASASRNSPRTGSWIDGTGTSSPSGSKAGVSVTGE
jgi:hypothetical protein